MSSYEKVKNQRRGADASSGQKAGQARDSVGCQAWPKRKNIKQKNEGHRLKYDSEKQEAKY